MECDSRIWWELPDGPMIVGMQSWCIGKGWPEELFGYGWKYKVWVHREKGEKIKFDLNTFVLSFPR